ncbi:molecular chaperone [soil metagenome]
MNVIAIDYGTSNCCCALVVDNTPQLVELEPGSVLLPSLLWVPHAPIGKVSVSEHEVAEIKASLLRQQADMRKRRRERIEKSGLAIEPAGLEKYDDTALDKLAYEQARSDAFQLAASGDSATESRAIEIRASEVLLGANALRVHTSDPSIGRLLRSPKNFLAVELDAYQLHYFEAATAAFLRFLRSRAEQQLGAKADVVVLGRPVTYHGARGDAGNAQAIDIMRKAAAQAGIGELVFEYEPVAAAMAYEQELTTDKTVLVLDAGGGTTDCTLMRVGPSRRGKADRTRDILGTSGERLGGVDLDVAFAETFFAPALGLNGLLKSGLAMPSRGIFDALSFNDIPAQTRFYGRKMGSELAEYLKDAVTPEPIARLISVRDGNLTMRLNHSAEQGKIGLSAADHGDVALDYVDTAVDIAASKHLFEKTIAAHIERIVQLMAEACKQGGEAPDEIFVTGGTSRLPILNRMVRERFPAIPIVNGDDFGSVVKGLALRASTLVSSKVR